MLSRRKLRAESRTPGFFLSLIGAFSASSFIPLPSLAETPTASETEQDAELPALPTRVYADAFITWIYKKPKRDGAPIGYIRGGNSVELRADGSTPAGVRVKRGCGKGWYAVMPAGYICLDHTASLQPTRYSESMRTLAPRPGPYPFDFALSMGSPSYRRVPTEDEWLRKESVFGEAKPRPLPSHWQGHEELVTDEHIAIGAAPFYLAKKGSVSRSPESRLVRRDVPFGSMLALSGSFMSEGRQFLSSADGTVVPADRFRLFRPSAFQGVELATKDKPGLSLPLAWPREKTRIYSLADACSPHGAGAETEPNRNLKRRRSSGVLDERPPELPESCLLKQEAWARAREVLQLSGRAVDIAGTRFVELGKTPSKTSRWVPLRSAFVAEQRERKGMAGTDTKWIQFTISQGTLVVYRGEKAVFATLASPGIGGVPSPGSDPLSTRTTPIGTYRIQFKHRTDDMSPEQTEDRSYWIADVPFAMYFQQPFAIHVAYWHESFGEPMSGGCINVSPRDGERLFSFADPPIPDDWYGVGASSEFGLGTAVVIDR